MSSKKYNEYSEQEKAVVFATCAELEGILAGISNKHELKVIPAFLWEDMMDTIALLKESVANHEEEIATLEHNLKVYEGCHEHTIKAFSSTEAGQLIIGDTEIIIPGVNGPRPEHMHLDRDTASGILRGKQASLKHKK